MIVDNKDKSEDEDERKNKDESKDKDKSKDGNKDKTEDSQIVQFSHFLVKEFLMSDQLAESSREVTNSQYHIQLGPAHMILAQACLGVLL